MSQVQAEPTRDVRNTARVVAFDGVRGFFFISVLLTHAGYEHWVEGRLGLYTFFTLSGFLITSLLLRENTRNGRVNFRDFYVRRFYRLAPALTLMIVATVIWGELVNRAVDFRLARPHLLYVIFYSANWWEAFHNHLQLGPYSHTWSLSVEEQFYILWPALLVLFALRPRTPQLGKALCIFGIAVAVVDRVIVAPSKGQPLDRLLVGTDTLLDQIMFGCLLAIVLHYAAEATRDRFARGASIAIWPAYAILAYGLLIRQHTGSHGPIVYTLTDAAIGAASATMLCHLYLNRDTWSQRFFRWKPFLVMGVVTYGWYVYHVPIFRITREFIDPTHKVEVALIAIPVSFVVAFLSYHYIELPIQRWGRRRAGGREPRTLPKVSRAEPAPAVSAD